jgi:hypothetical protein
MNNLEPSVDWRNRGRPGDPDGLLRAFFRAELPDPWPEFRRPDRSARPAAPARPPAGRSWTAMRSRLALAATVAVLLLGTLLLSGKFHNSPAEPPLGTPSAKSPWPYIQKESLLQEVEERTGPDGKPIRQDQPTKLLIEFYEP